MGKFPPRASRRTVSRPPSAGGSERGWRLRSSCDAPGSPRPPLRALLVAPHAAGRGPLGRRSLPWTRHGRRRHAARIFWCRRDKPSRTAHPELADPDCASLCSACAWASRDPRQAGGGPWGSRRAGRWPGPAVASGHSQARAAFTWMSSDGQP